MRMRPFRGTLFWIHAAAFVCLSLNCMRSTAPSPREAGEPARVKFTFDGADDPRSYSVGTVVMRAFDLEGNLLVASTTFESNRETGLFEFDFTLPAGPDRIVVAEPRGSGLPAGGGKTESGIALQGRDTLDVPAGGEPDSIVINLKPFIPDSLEVIIDRFEDEVLTWKSMEIATSHVIRFEEWNATLSDFVPIEIEHGATNELRLDDIRSVPGALVTRFQIASVNDISQSAFTDTLFYDQVPAPAGGNPLSGTVVDATTGDPVAGATVTVDGPVVRTTTTDENGAYIFPDLPDGTYSTTIERDGFVIESATAVIDGAPAEADVIISPSLSAGQFRIVLSWGELPADLDAHLWISPGSHVFWDTLGSSDSPPFAILDVDDRNGIGPETVTIHQLTGTCRYFVHNFSGEIGIAGSRAEVRLYSADSLLQTYTVPQSGEGRWWHVLDIDANGNVTTDDFLTDSIFAKPNIKVKKDGAFTTLTIGFPYTLSWSSVGLPGKG